MTKSLNFVDIGGILRPINYLQQASFPCNSILLKPMANLLSTCTSNSTTLPSHTNSFQANFLIKVHKFLNGKLVGTIAIRNGGLMDLTMMTRIPQRLNRRTKLNQPAQVGLGLSIGRFGSNLDRKIPIKNRIEFPNPKPKPTEAH